MHHIVVLVIVIMLVGEVVHTQPQSSHCHLPPSALLNSVAMTAPATPVAT